MTALLLEAASVVALVGCAAWLGHLTKEPK